MMIDKNDVANENAVVAGLTKVLHQGMFTTNEEFILRCAEVGILVEEENGDFYYRLEGSDLSYGGGGLGEQYTIDEITWLAEGIDELRNFDVEGAKTLPVGELVTVVSEWLDARPAEWAAAKAKYNKVA